MTYKIQWTKLAIQELAQVWLDSTDRDSVSRAIFDIEQQLGRAPREFGESRASPLRRVGFCSGVAIEFDVIEDDLRVVVRAVWAMNRG